MSKLPNKDKEKPVIKSKNPEKIEKKPIVQEIKPADDQKIIQKNIKKKLLNSYNHIPRNVNLYRHLITEANTTETDIDWILGLRYSQKSNEKLKKAAMDPFRVYDKSTETGKEKKIFTDLDTIGDISNCEHLIFSRIGPTVSKSLVSFETTLRNYSLKDNMLKKKELTFWPYAKKDRKEFPSFLPPLKEELDLRAKSKMSDFTLNSKNFVSAFEGRLHYPKYDIRFKERNINRYLHLTEKDLEKGTIDWELGLR